MNDSLDQATLERESWLVFGGGIWLYGRYWKLGDVKRDVKEGIINGGRVIAASAGHVRTQHS